MARCLQLAALGAGTVAPNPMVGAVLVHEGRIIGEGFHQQYGQAHAEVNCLHSVPEKDSILIPDSTLYVSLEPCAHFGKTPPCTELIIRHQIKTVVVGCRDPFAEVNGKGIEKLRGAGIQVVMGILEEECMQLNKRFFGFHTNKRPYTILKWAQSANHCIAGKDRQRVNISGELTNRLVHRWRVEEASIAVGTQTALIDQPALTARLWPGPQPTRILLDKQLVVPKSQAIFSAAAPTIVFNLLRSGVEGHVKYMQLLEAGSVVKQLLENLYALQIQSLIVEGGARFLQSFLDENAWDEARIITNTEMIISDGYAAPALNHGRLLYGEQIDADLVQYFTNS
nr:bifunctional diaminohydroxyphosphoribosylaminopyrimidine deaminase/5-amino-6-(5-phosphoribosylamino)uracil reductase RibD [Flavihumibacter fluvii]